MIHLARSPGLVVPRIVGYDTFRYGYQTTNSSGVLELYPFSNVLIGDSTKRAGHMPRRGCLLRVHWTVDLNALGLSTTVTGRCNFTGSATTNVDLTLFSGGAATGDGQEIEQEYAVGVHTFEKGDLLEMQRRHDGTCTTDDIIVSVHVGYFR